MQLRCSTLFLHGRGSGFRFLHPHHQKCAETRGPGTHEGRKPVRDWSKWPRTQACHGGKYPAKPAETAQHRPPGISPLLTAIPAIAPPHQQPPVFARKLDHVTRPCPGSAGRNQTSPRPRVSRAGAG